MNSTSNPFPDLPKPFLPDPPKPFPVRLEDLCDPTFSDGLSPSEHLDRLYGRVSPPLPTEEVAKLIADEWRLAAKLLSAGASEQSAAVQQEALTRDELNDLHGAPTVNEVQAASEQLGAIAGPAEALTDENIEAEFNRWYKDCYGLSYFATVRQKQPLSYPAIVKWTKFALAHYGRPALEPTTKGNRPILKSNPFHNEDGECWCFESADRERDVPASWHLRVPYHADEYFLPHYHFPVPGNHSPGATKMAEPEGQS